jgi:hypothetical protein
MASFYFLKENHDKLQRLIVCLCLEHHLMTFPLFWPTKNEPKPRISLFKSKSVVTVTVSEITFSTIFLQTEKVKNPFW